MRENSQSKITREDIVRVAHEPILGLGGFQQEGEIHPVNGFILYFIFVPVVDLEL